MIERIKISTDYESKSAGTVTAIPSVDGNLLSFFIVCPKCLESFSISYNHTKDIDRDGKLTIHPSILHEPCGAHFFITKNKIEHV